MSSQGQDQFKLFFIFSVFTVMAIMVLGPESHSQSAVKIKSQDEITRSEMTEMSRQLGVTCTECHKVENFKDSSKVNFHKAKEHMRIVELLKGGGFDGKSGPQATCYMCHRGELRPAFKEGMKLMPVKKEEAKKDDAKGPKKETQQ
jgi:nitrate/TMAO reductase-like tetraheme cytochrome c subunit